MLNTLPLELREKSQNTIQKKRLIGHFRNIIYRFSLTLDRKSAGQMLKFLLKEKLSEFDHSTIFNKFDKLYDIKKSEAYLRINKGSLLQEQTTLTSSNESPVKLRIKFQLQGKYRKEPTKSVLQFLKSICLNEVKTP